MFLLVLTILASLSVSVFFRWASVRSINLNYSIAINYLVAFLLCIMVFEVSPPQVTFDNPPSWLILTLGFLLPLGLWALSRSYKECGIASTKVAQQISFVLPLIGAFTVFGEGLSIEKVAGIYLSLISMAFLLGARAKKLSSTGIFYLLLVWMTYGLAEFIFKEITQLQYSYVDTLVMGFALAFVVCLIFLIITRSSIDIQSCLLGIPLGIFNFMNIYFYVESHAFFPDHPSLVFTSINLGGMVGAVVVGKVLFKEYLSVWQYVGIFCAISAILFFA